MFAIVRTVNCERGLWCFLLMVCQYRRAVAAPLVSRSRRWKFAECQTNAHGALGLTVGQWQNRSREGGLTRVTRQFRTCTNFNLSHRSLLEDDDRRCCHERPQRMKLTKESPRGERWFSRNNLLALKAASLAFAK